MLPNFVVIGAQRCATGWISQCLREHPDIYMARDETRFFDNYYDKGIRWWQREFFADYAGEKAVGEKTANYLYNPRSAERIAQTLPNAKLICCLRNPVTRMWSNYIMKINQKKSKERQEFEQAVKTDPELVERGLYFKQLNRFLNYFSPEQLMVTIYEHKFANPVLFMQNIYRFLGVDAEYVPPSAKIQVKPGAFEQIYCFPRIIARALTTGKSPFRRLYSRIRPDDMQIKVDDDKYKDLIKLFLPDIHKLENIINKNLSIWKKPC